MYISRESVSRGTRRAGPAKERARESLVRDIARHLYRRFVLELYRTYQSRDVCYFLLEFIQGGELFSYIDNGIDEKEVSWFAANVVDVTKPTKGERRLWTRCQRRKKAREAP